jgi:hypothetical protein
VKYFLFLAVVLWGSTSIAAGQVCDTALFMEDSWEADSLFLVSRDVNKPVARVAPHIDSEGMYKRSKDCRWVVFDGRLVDLTQANQSTVLPNFAKSDGGHFSEDSRWLVYFNEQEKQYYSIDLKTLKFQALDLKASEPIDFKFVPGSDFIVAEAKSGSYYTLSAFPLTVSQPG